MTRRVLLGRLPATGNQGLIISKPGYPADANPPDTEQLLFSTDWAEMVPIYQAGNTSVSSGTTKTITFPALGYVPVLLLYALGPSILRSGSSRSEIVSLVHSDNQAGQSIYADVFNGSFTINFPGISGFTYIFYYNVLLNRAL